MSTFFRFPHTPHLSWLGPGAPRDDKVLGPAEQADLLRGPVSVEEKIDGANVGLSVAQSGLLQAQNRGSFLSADGCHPQFRPLFRWLASREVDIAQALSASLIVFGEWCYAVHSIYYDRLPDWFMVFDVYDRHADCFWDSRRRDELAAHLGLSIVPTVARGKYCATAIAGLLNGSAVTDGPSEGLYVRREEAGRVTARAKLVRAEFTQTIDEHWSRRMLRTNRLASGATWV